MNSYEIFDVIEQIAVIGSKTKKQSVVKEYCEYHNFRSVVAYAYSPHIVFGIATVPDRTMPGAGHFDGVNKDWNRTTWQILDDLASRRLAGNSAREAVQSEIDRLDYESSELFRRILKKDLRAGFSASTINKAYKGLIPTYPYMRCCLPKDTDLNDFDWKTGVISQEKADGMFVNVNKIGNEVTLHSRQGTPFPSEPFAKLIEEVSQFLPSDNQYHGELLVMCSGGVLPREQSNGVLNSVVKGGSFGPDKYPILQLWDCIPMASVAAKGEYKTTYRIRLARLVNALRRSPLKYVSLVPTKIVHSLDDAYRHYGELLASGKEGTIIKDPHAVWRDGTSKRQVKFKLEVDVDLEVADFVPGEGKNADTFGSIFCISTCGFLQVAVSGFTDAMRKTISDNRDDYRGMVITVRANSVMMPTEQGGPYSLFLPRFVEFRTDKTEGDTLNQIINQFESAVKKAA